MPFSHSLASGDVEAFFGSGEAEMVLEGEAKMGGQVGRRRRWRWLAGCCMRAALVVERAALQVPVAPSVPRYPSVVAGRWTRPPPAYCVSPHVPLVAIREPAEPSLSASLTLPLTPALPPPHTHTRTPQEHFYLEPMASIVIPAENDEFLSFSSTQVCVVAGARPGQWQGA